ncbi:uncharacterized protein N7482_007534 [Penicillium canariense]|uniref:Uncharacterized protein n=1 Tax=Penicillium canariense TaxID=189055 RepID=A0A9W9HZR2_9EURO|nr:uncharacterized protein N7482_007534 [Penicillium canariense]KAJ5160530.1 hypothetical protein N7482_007534 [Penicillium canariense]
MPKLTTEVPTDLQRTTGVADEILAKREEERGRKRDHDSEDMEGRHGHSPKRARSLSSDSANSISTISTNRSASASPDRHSKHGSHTNGHRSSASPPHGDTRKRRYSDSSDGYSAKGKAAPGNVEEAVIRKGMILEKETGAARMLPTTIHKNALIEIENRYKGLRNHRSLDDPGRNPGRAQDHLGNEA